MTEAPLHREFLHFSEIPYSQRAVYTAALLILGMGYLFALIYLFYTYSGKDGNPMTLSYEDIVIAYSGSGKDSRLESALRGPMSAMLPRDEAGPIVDWVKAGADRTGYEKAVRATLDKRCMTCHDGSNPHLVNLNGFDNLKKVTERDTGTGLPTLVRVSHIHLFGLTFIFFIVASIFTHAYVRPVWFKCFVVAVPFVSIAVDILSWYVTKYFHPFAYVVMAAGGVSGLCFGLMFVISMWQMWIGKVPAAVRERSAEGTLANVG